MLFSPSYNLLASEKIGRLAYYFRFIDQLFYQYDIIKDIIIFSGRFDSRIALFVDFFQTYKFQSILKCFREADFNDQDIIDFFYDLFHGARCSTFLICDFIHKIDSIRKTKILVDSEVLHEIVFNYNLEDEFDIIPLNKIEKTLDNSKITFL